MWKNNQEFIEKKTPQNYKISYWEIQLEIKIVSLLICAYMFGEGEITQYVL